MTATNPGGYNVASALHPVVPVAPLASFTSNTPVIIGNFSVFSNISTGGGTIGYQWNFGDGTPLSIAPHPSHLYDTDGSFTVILTATDEGGTDVFSGLHQVIKEPDNDVFLPLLMNAVSATHTHTSDKVMVQSCEPEKDGLLSFLSGLAGAL